MRTNRHPIRLAIFAVNFAVAVMFSISCVIGVFAPPSGGVFFSSVCSFVPITAYALCEWVAGYRGNVALERGLGWANLALAAFLAFGLVVNIGEEIVAPGPVDVKFLSSFALTFTSGIAYLALAGWMRLRWTRERKVGQ